MLKSNTIMLKILLLLFAAFSVSCNTKTSEDTSPESLEQYAQTEEKTTEDSLNVLVDFEKNKLLLDIILLLPEQAFDSWTWKPEDRKSWYNEIKKNDFFVDYDLLFFNLIYLEPYKARFQIVDGTWSINLYAANDKSYIVVTDDVVGDGHDLNFFEYKSGKLTSIDSKNSVLVDYLSYIKKPTDAGNGCGDLDEPDYIYFNYDFSNQNTVEIESSWYFTQQEYGNCLNGNALICRFNPDTKSFDLDKVYWKPKAKQSE